jgi:RNA polymerase sigma-70 factor, ECF subfamily
VPRGPVSRALEAVQLVDLVKRVASGDEGDFIELYDATSSRVYGSALQMLRSPRLAAEVTEEVYVEVWRQASRYDPSKGGVLAWMMSMVHRRSLDRMRRISKEPAREQYATANGDREFDRLSDEVIESRLDADRAREAMRSLTDIERQALTLAYFKGCSQTEVARLLGLPLGTVKSLIRDGLIGLRDALGVRT